jgi:hypothetical protein
MRGMPAVKVKKKTGADVRAGFATSTAAIT